MLAHYYHGAGLTAEVASLLPSSMRTQVRWFQPMRRLLPFTVPKRHQDHVFLAMLKRFDTFIARKLEASPCAAVIAYERSALETFTAAKRVGAACILDAASLHHTAQSNWFPKSNSEQVSRRKDAEIELADLIITCSALARDSYLAAGIPAHKLRTIPLGTDLQLFSASRRQANDGPIRFCNAGLIDAKKGVDILVDACRQLRAARIGAFHVDIAGNASIADPRLVDNVRSVATITSRMPQHELAKFYSRADVFVMPSRFDSFGMVVPEAMACGLPVIVTENVGSKDLVTHGVNGWIIPAGDASALADRMAWCVNNPQAVRAMGPAARAAAAGRSWNAYRGEVSAAVADFLAVFRPAQNAHARAG
jgi:glycosyltransferase involved in cell wall biosynthesis